MYRNGAYTFVNGAVTQIPFDTVSYDPNGNLTTGASANYTVPVSGYYVCTGRIGYNSDTSALGNIMSSYIYQNGSEIKTGSSIFASAASQFIGSNVDGIIKCVAGDTLDMRYYATAAVAADVANSGRLFFDVHFISPA